MKVTLYMAMSLNGIIATQNGSEYFLSDQNWKTFVSLAKQTGNFIVGRKTYEAVKKWDYGFNFDSVDNVEKIIISQQNITLDEGYILADSPQKALEKLDANGFKQALVTGGATVNSAFMKDGLIDEIILNIEPVVIGQGINLFSQENFESRLRLIEQKQLKDGIIQVHYKVKR